MTINRGTRIAWKVAAGLALMLAAACGATNAGGADHETPIEHGTIRTVSGTGFSCTWKIVRTKPDGKPDNAHPKNLYGQRCEPKPGAGYRLYKDGSVAYTADVKFRYGDRHQVQAADGSTVCRVTYEHDGLDNQHKDLAAAFCADRSPPATQVFTVWTSG